MMAAQEVKHLRQGRCSQHGKTVRLRYELPRHALHSKFMLQVVTDGVFAEPAICALHSHKASQAGGVISAVPSFSQTVPRLLLMTSALLLSCSSGGRLRHLIAQRAPTDTHAVHFALDNTPLLKQGQGLYAQSTSRKSHLRADQASLQKGARQRVIQRDGHPDCKGRDMDGCDRSAAL